LLRIEDDSSVLAAAVGTDVKGRASPLMYGLGIDLSFADRWLGIAAYTTPQPPVLTSPNRLNIRNGSVAGATP
jgi:hypothetical protein